MEPASYASVSLVALVALGALSALTTVVCAFYIKFSGPVAAKEALDEWLGRLEAIESQWRSKGVELEQLQDAIARDYENVGRSRNRLTALESKARRRDLAEQKPAEATPVTREQWEVRARQQNLFDA